MDTKWRTKGEEKRKKAKKKMNFNQKNIFTFYSYFSFINKKIVLHY